MYLVIVSTFLNKILSAYIINFKSEKMTITHFSKPTLLAYC